MFAGGLLTTSGAARIRPRPLPPEVASAVLKILAYVDMYCEAGRMAAALLERVAAEEREKRRRGA